MQNGEPAPSANIGSSASLSLAWYIWLHRADVGLQRLNASIAFHLASFMYYSALELRAGGFNSASESISPR